MREFPPILIIAGSDSSGGAGIQADIKTVTMRGGYAMTAITALTAQNTLGVSSIHAVPPEFVAAQIESCLSDIGAEAIKIGMLFSAAIIDAVEPYLAQASCPIVLDPVMVATSGATLLDKAALTVLKRIIPLATVITPNIPEAELLTGHSIQTNADMENAGCALLGQGAKAVLIKGGHGVGANAEDALITQDATQWFSSPRLHSRQTHGTGCTLAAAIATHLAQGDALALAIAKARDYVWQAIDQAPGYGKGNGPLNHLVRL